MLGAFAGFWISYAALVIGLAHNWYAIPPTAILHTVGQFLIVSVGGNPLPFGKPALSLLGKG